MAQGVGLRLRLISLGLGGLFFATWLGLIAVFWECWDRLRPAMGVGDPASFVSGTLFLLLGLYLAQGFFYWVRPRVSFVAFPEKILSTSPLVFLLWPSTGYLVEGAGLAATSTAQGAENILNDVSQCMTRFPLLFRLAMLLDGRNPVDLLLETFIAKFPRILSWPAWLLYWLMEPSRLFLRFWGFIFYIFLQKWGDSSPEDELTIYKRKVASDLAWRAEKQGLDPHDCFELNRILAALRRVYHEPGYGGPVETTEAGAESSIYQSPWLNPKYQGAYLDWPVTGTAWHLMDLYDQAGEAGDNDFYPPQLGQEVMVAALVASERRRLAEKLTGWRTEGLMILDGRLRLSWEVEAKLADMKFDLANFERRLAAHHRRCHSWYQARARRRGPDWAEALQAWLGWLFFCEQAISALRTAEENYVKISGMDSMLRARIFYGAWQNIVDLLNFKNPLGVNDGFKIEPWAAPTTATLDDWKAQRSLQLGQLMEGLTDMGHEALTALLELHQQLDDWAVAGSEGDLTPPSPGPCLPPQWAKPASDLQTREMDQWSLDDLPKEDSSPKLFQTPFLKPERAELLKVCPVRVALTALVLGLFWWNGQSLGLSDLVVYNGLGSVVVVEIGGQRLEVAAHEAEKLSLAPNRVVRVKTLIRGQIVEEFSQPLASVPAREIYNVAGAAPLLEWSNPRHDGQDTRFLGRPRWLVTQARILFTDPNPGQNSLVISGYGDQSPPEILGAFEDQRDKNELIYLHATWDHPDSQWYDQWKELSGDRNR